MQVKWGYRSINGDYVFQMVEDMKREFIKNNKNKKICDLGVGDVKLPPPFPISNELLKAQLEMGNISTFKGYGDELGYKRLREIISESYLKRGEKLFFDEIFITTGAKPGLNEIIELCSFKRALIFTPTYPLYKELCKANKIEFECFDEDESIDFVLSKLKGEKAVDLIFLCSPNNPTGKVFNESELKKLISYCSDKGAILLMDCAYFSFCEDFPKVYNIKGAENCLVEVHSFSKSISFTGLRLGYTIIKRENVLYDAYKKFLSLKSNGVNIVVQRGACSFFGKECEVELRKRLLNYRKSGEIIKNTFKKHNIFVKGGKYAPYVFCKTGDGEKFAKDILIKKAVLVTPGSGFDCSDYIRISCLAPSDEIKRGAVLIDEYISEIAKK